MRWLQISILVMLLLILPSCSYKEDFSSQNIHNLSENPSDYNDVTNITVIGKFDYIYEFENKPVLQNLVGENVRLFFTCAENGIWNSAYKVGKYYIAKGDIRHTQLSPLGPSNYYLVCTQRLEPYYTEN